MTTASPMRWDGDDLVLQVRVQPRARTDEILGIQAGALKIRITAPPIDGKANTHLVALLAHAFKVAKSDVHLESGGSARSKRFRIIRPRHLPAQLLNVGL